jgi:ubiquinone/menaquinone biosynthesis C-methylase UbiE
MRFVNFFSRQARKPTGVFGRFFMPKVFDKGNAELNALTLATLPVKDDSHVLEIGCGTGALMEKLAGRAPLGLVEGVDFSRPMVSIARKRNKDAVRRGAVRIHLGDFQSLPFDEESFDVVVTVNTIYFWEKPTEAMAKIYKLLRPGGVLVLGLHEKSEMEQMTLAHEIFRYYSVEDMKALFSDSANFRDVRVVSAKGAGKVAYCALGVR